MSDVEEERLLRARMAPLENFPAWRKSSSTSARAIPNDTAALRKLLES